MLMEFYGQECPHCIAMMPIVEKLKNDGVKIEQYEVWHDDKNAKLLENYDTGLCGGVPFFYNTETKKFICGGASEEELRALAEGK